MTQVCLELEAGASDDALRGVVQALGEHNAVWYRENPDARRPSGHWLRYQPDAPSTDVRLYDAAALLRRSVGSCGSIAAAYYGWLKARGRRAWLLVQRRGPEIWHVVVRTDRGIWDPARLPHARQRRAS